MEKDYLKFIEQFLNESSVLKPQPTLLKPLTRADPKIKCVVFDIYGTILISASGDIDETEITIENLKTALDASEIRISNSLVNEYSLLSGMLETFKKSIRDFHSIIQNENLPYPEIDILEIWENIINDYSNRKELIINGSLCIKCFTFVFEVLSNRIYPMPGLTELIDLLAKKAIPLGIISNAQFYTPVILNFFLHHKVVDQNRVSPFDPDLTVFSYEYKRSKPDAFLFEVLKNQCRQKYSIYADEILFVGNDMYRDIYPAYRAGFKTALFAGDAKSLRLREDKTELQTITPDFIITDLMQLLKIIT